jgi:hypothetical protein
MPQYEVLSLCYDSFALLNSELKQKKALEIHILKGSDISISEVVN